MMADMTSLLQTQEVGLAVRPTVALLNHSCCPNTVRASAGSQVKDTFLPRQQTKKALKLIHYFLYLLFVFGSDHP